MFGKTNPKILVLKYSRQVVTKAKSTNEKSETIVPIRPECFTTPVLRVKRQETFSNVFYPQQEGTHKLR